MSIILVLQKLPSISVYDNMVMMVMFRETSPVSYYVIKTSQMLYNLPFFFVEPGLIVD